MASGTSGPMLKKLWSSTGTGSPFGRHSRPAAGNRPSCSLLRIHADHRRTGGLMGLDLLVDVGELRIAVGMLPALQRRGRALQAEPVLPQQPAHRWAETGCPCSVSSPARCRSDFVVQ